MWSFYSLLSYYLERTKNDKLRFLFNKFLFLVFHIKLVTICYGLNGIPMKVYIEALTSSVTALENRPLGSN